MVSILFVDDEEYIIKALKREFSKEDYTILTATNAYDAFLILEKNHVDIIVSDVKMPEIDGITFLTEVKKKYPLINRIFLSGFVEQKTVIDSLSRNIVTAYFPKPWKQNQLKEGIAHIVEVRNKLAHIDILNTINSITNLPTLPSIYKSFQDALNENKSIEELIKIIETDTAVTTRILQVVNSAFYTKSNVGSIEKAIDLLGLNNVKDILLTFSFTESINWRDDQLYFLKEIIDHSSLLNKKLLKYMKFLDNNAMFNQCKSIGLPHDIGKLVILFAFDNDYKKIQTFLDQNSKKTFFEAEKILFPTKPTHQELGGYLLTLWNIPQTIIEVTLFHHEPQNAHNEYKKLVEIAHYIDYCIDLLKRDKTLSYDKITDYKFTYLTSNNIKEIFNDIQKEYNVI